jgi:hypothetical protein
LKTYGQKLGLTPHFSREESLQMNNEREKVKEINNKYF